MKKLPEVEAAKQLMKEATKWSVMTWLGQKKRVRKAADQANAALDNLSDQLKQRWPDSLRARYEALASGNSPSRLNGRSREKVMGKELEESVTARKLREADDRARHARDLAERTFDEAERKLSTSLAREGCRQAIEAWDLHENAIVQSEKYAL